jgi:toxin ParE1/3/4
VPKRHRIRLYVTDPARRDIAEIVRWSLREFGEDAALRYDALIHQALRDIEADPGRPSAKPRPEFAEGALAYHLRNSRDRARISLGIVHNPRHFVICRLRDGVIDVLRIIHDARALDQHLRSSRTGSAHVVHAQE